jgi:uncharacterized membrane protein YhaH (DUF805 family)
MKFIEAIKFGFKNYVNFKGVVGRSIFWLWALFLAIGFTVTSVLLPLPLFFLAAIALPTLALTARRLRDAGLSAVLLAFWLLPVLVSLNVMTWVRNNENFVPDPIAEGNAGYIPVHAFATGFVSLLAFVFGILIGSVILGILCILPTRTKDQGNKRIRE